MISNTGIVELTLPIKLNKLLLNVFFLKDMHDSNEIRIEKFILDKRNVCIFCYNFEDTYATNRPISLGVFNGNEIFINLWFQKLPAIHRMFDVFYTVYERSESC